MKSRHSLRVICAILSALMILSVFTAAPVFAVDTHSARTSKKMGPPTDSGTTGDCEWAFYEDENLLVITGEGSTGKYVAGGPWNSYADKIKSIDIRDGVDGIDDNCFYGLPYVEDVSIADSVCSIGDYAFYGNTSLSYVELPDELTSLGEGAFNRTGLERVDINDKLGPIGSCAFAETKMKNVYIPENVGYIGDKAFGYISGEFGYEADAEFVIFGEKGSVAYEYASNNMFVFREPYSGTMGLDIQWSFDPESGTLTFSGTGDMTDYDSEHLKPWDSRSNPCIGYITKVVVKDGITSVGDYAFSDFHNNHIGDVELADSVKKIGENAFSGCNELTQINYPTSLASIGYSAFTDCAMLENPEFPDTANFTEIGGYAYFNCDFDSVEIPSSVTTIGKKAFGYKFVDEAETRDDSFIIIGSPDSTAKEYADNCGFKFVKTPVELTLDLNGAAVADNEASLNLSIPEESFTSLKSTGVCTIPCRYGVKYNFRYGDYIAACDPPADMEPDGFEVDGVACPGENKTIDIKDDTTIKLLWKEKVKIAKYQLNLNGFELLSPSDSIPTEGEVELGTTKDIGTVLVEGVFPHGKLFDGIEVNGVRTTDLKVTFDEDKTIDLLWKDAETSGTSGNVSWSYDEATKTLTFSGEGEMSAYTSLIEIPWLAYMKECENVVFEDGVSEIGKLSFWNFVNLKNVSFPNTSLSIRERAFAQCSSLRSLVFKNSVGLIDKLAFIGVPLESIYVMNPYLKLDDTKIGYDAAGNKLDNMAIYADKGSKAEEYADANGFTFLTRDAYKEPVDLGTYTYQFDSITGCLVISGSEMPYFISSEVAPWYEFRDEIKKVIIEDGVKNISDEAFYKCTSLQEVIIPESVKAIGRYVFADTTNMVNIEIQGEGLETVDTGAFFNSGITNIKLPGSVTDLENSLLGYVSVSESTSEMREGFTIIAPKGSKAEEYANNHSAFVFEPLGEAETTAPADTTEAVETTAPVDTTEAADTTAPTDTTKAAETTEPVETPVPADTTKAATEPSETASAADTTAAPKNTTVKPAVKPNPVKVTVKTKTVSIKKAKAKKTVLKAVKIKNAKGKVAVKLIKKGTSKKIRKKIKVSKKGVITFKKGTYKKGTYKIKIRITVSGDKSYASAKLTKTVKVRFK